MIKEISNIAKRWQFCILVIAIMSSCGNSKLEGLGMNLFLKSPKMWKDSATLAFLAAIETIMSVAAISLTSAEKWWVRLLLIIAVYCVLTIGILLFKFLYARKSITLSIRGIQVKVKQGDLFKSDGWKLIPFDERYDTQVDDIVINKNSLNGIFI